MDKGVQQLAQIDPRQPAVLVLHSYRDQQRGVLQALLIAVERIELLELLRIPF